MYAYIVNSQGRQNEPQEWGEFLHQPGVKYTDYNRIMDEIISETDAKTGDSGRILHVMMEISMSKVVVEMYN